MKTMNDNIFEGILLEDPALGRSMGAAGRQRAEALFDIRFHAARVAALYERVLAA